MNNIGIIGLGVMGRNLAFNLCDHGYQVAGYNRSVQVTRDIMAENIKNFTGYETVGDMVESLASPRIVLLMVKAGDVTDSVIDDVVQYLKAGDILIDGGNSFYKDSIKRSLSLEAQNITYFGVGISGGEKGARYGAALIPSGPKDKYPLISGMLEAIAASKDGEPCCKYIGPIGSGHYVKMVHNGIEYADMQLIAECYLILKKMMHYNNHQIANVFKEFNKGKAQSYLLAITIDILETKDNLSDDDLIDRIKDVSAHKGTGKWTANEAINDGVDSSMIIGAYLTRVISSYRDQRDAYCDVKVNHKDEIDIKLLRNAYYLSKVLTYAQGFNQMMMASNQNNWDLSLSDIASIFRAGCIIQAELLEVLMKVYQDEKQSDLLLSKWMMDLYHKYIDDLQKVIIKGVKHNLPIPLLTSGWVYFSQISAPLLGANLIQAQRDYFGSHTYERIDQIGSFHYEWE